jgi:hypothetical protein
LQVEVPWHCTIELAPVVRVQSLPPLQVAWLSLPVESVQVLPPAQLEVQPDWQVPMHMVWPSQVVLQLVPQSTEQVLRSLQLKVTPLGSESPPPSPAAPPSPATIGPRVQASPAAHWQIVPVQLQAPVHMMGPPSWEASTERSAPVREGFPPHAGTTSRRSRPAIRIP